MHTFVDLYFTPESASPLDLAHRIREEARLEFILGPHDFVFEWTSVEEFRETLARLHRALKGSGVLYRLETVRDEPAFVEPVPWPPPIRGRDTSQHPGYSERR